LAQVFTPNLCNLLIVDLLKLLVSKSRQLFELLELELVELILLFIGVK
jgi:hypothetical protein